MPIYFRLLTLLAFHVFHKEQVDVAVIEVGIGGRTDCTNIVNKPIVTGITSIGYDHMNLLGNTLQEIAFEKSGIFKQGVPAFSIQNQVPEVEEYLGQRALKLSGGPLRVAKLLPEINNIKLGIEGDHQKVNAMLAVELAREWLLQCQHQPKFKDRLAPLISHVQDTQTIPEIFVPGLEKNIWPGRSQTIHFSENISLFLDGAHTTESISACQKWFSSKRNSAHQTILVFNCMPSRDPTPFFQMLGDMNVFSRVIFTSNDVNKGEPILKNLKLVDELTKATTEKTWQEILQGKWTHPNVPTETSPDIPTTFSRISELQSEFGKPLQVLCTGSLYLVGAVLEYIEERK